MERAVRPNISGKEAHLKDAPCDPGRHLQQYPGAQAGKGPKECFWARGSECPIECSEEFFLGHGAPECQAALLGALFGAL